MSLHYTVSSLTLTTLILLNFHWHMLMACIILKIISGNYLRLISHIYYSLMGKKDGILLYQYCAFQCKFKTVHIFTKI